MQAQIHLSQSFSQLKQLGLGIMRYGGKSVVGFADGHVKAVTPEEAKSLRWKP